MERKHDGAADSLFRREFVKGAAATGAVAGGVASCDVAAAQVIHQLQLRDVQAADDQLVVSVPNLHVIQGADRKPRGGTSFVVGIDIASHERFDWSPTTNERLVDFDYQQNRIYVAANDRILDKPYVYIAIVYMGHHSTQTIFRGSVFDGL